MQLPYSEELNIGYLSRLFDNTTNCYKFFWFQAILRKLDGVHCRFTFDELINEMIADAWYMVTEYHLRLGPLGITDNLEEVVKYIYRNYGFMSSEKREKIIEFLQTRDDKRITKYKSDLTLNVPYRLQVPFYDEINIERSMWNGSKQALTNEINRQKRLMYYFTLISGLSKVRYSDVKAFYYSLINERGFKPASMEIAHTLLHPTFNMAVRDGYLNRNPTDGVMGEIKKSHQWEHKKRHALTIEQQSAVSTFLDTHEDFRGWRPIITVLLGTGMRIGECLGLRWEDIDFKANEIDVNHNLIYRKNLDGKCENHVNSPKTESGKRRIPILEGVKDALLEELELQRCIGFCKDEIDGYSGFIFSTCENHVYTPESVNRAIKRIYTAYNEEETFIAKKEQRDPILLPHFSAHVLRHTFCTRLCENETNLREIMDIMGHSDIQTTMNIYAEVTGVKKQESMMSLSDKILF